MKSVEGPGGATRGDIQARLMLVVLCVFWGVTWPLMKVALNGIPPFSMRTCATGIGALTLLTVCFVMRRSLRVPNARAWGHLVVCSLLNIVAFSLLTAFAQLAAATGRVAIVAYTMPIWAVLMAWAVLGERPTRMQGAAVVLCAVGLGVLIEPLATNGIPLGLVLALGTGLSWAAGTVYLKWARIDADPMSVATWQIIIAFFIIAACMLVFEGGLHLEAANGAALFGVAFTGFFGNGLAYALWFAIVPRLSAATASIGVLGSPVIGLIASIFILGERPTLTDVVGFALILAACVCVLVARQTPPLPSVASEGGAVTP